MKTPTNRSEVIGQLYATHQQQICSFIMSRINDINIAEDLTQDVWMRLLQSDKEISPETAVSYIYTIARNIVNDYLRAYYVRQEAKEQIMESSNSVDTIDGEHTLIAMDLAQFERNRVECLPKQRRMIYVMCRYQEKSVNDIAEELSLSFRTVENHLRMGRRDVREYMSAIA